MMLINASNASSTIVTTVLYTRRKPKQTAHLQSMNDVADQIRSDSSLIKVDKPQAYKHIKQ